MADDFLRPVGAGPLSIEQTNRVNTLLRGARDRGVAADPALTRREHQVMLHVLRAELSRDTARALGVSFRTVELHRARILAKFGARSTVHLFALLIGSVEPGEGTDG
ncbi:MAG: LuxR C-terminal-related transcriptional regulator [Dichotomicrobium sp.]